MKFRHALVAAVLTFGFSATSAQSKCEAEAFVQSAGNAFLSAARAGSPQAFTSAASRFADLRGIALFALGQHRKSLPKGREAEYVSLARTYMGGFMAKYADRFSGTGLKVVSCSGNTVNASTAAGKKLMFRVSGGKGKYRVQDVNVSSVWLAGQMRSTFVGVINRNNGDINALFTYLRK
jgi:phospholipid transport system substrate-binding protein